MGHVLDSENGPGADVDLVVRIWNFVRVRDAVVVNTGDPQIKIAYYLIKLVVVLTFTAVCAILLLLQRCMRLTRLPRPEPVITINLYEDEEDVPTIELPRDSFRRLRGRSRVLMACRITSDGIFRGGHRWTPTASS
jgi:hypothetical protein